MLKKIMTALTVLIATISALAVAGVPDVSNWWELTKPWVISFFISLIFGIVINNMEIIRRYTYPTFVCSLAWAYNHKIIKTTFARHAYNVYKNNQRSYSKLFELTQYLYDCVMLEG